MEQHNSPNHSKLSSLPVVSDLEKALADISASLPSLPANIKELFVKVAPYLAIIGGVLQVLAIIALVGLSPLAMMGTAAGTMMGDINAPSFGILYIVSIVFIAAGAFLDFAAFPKLKVNNKKGWDYMYYAVLLSAVHGLITINAVNLLGTVIGIVLSLYILFQLRPYYKY